MKIATWNVNSIRARHDRVLRWLERHQPDVLCLQELKVREADFPRLTIEAAGYKAAVLGQKTYNGVAILARQPLEDVRLGLGEDDPQARLVSARVGGVRVLSAYFPNGRTVGSESYSYKLEWMSRLRSELDTSYDPDEPLALCGDFNVAPAPRDVHDPAAWEASVLFHPTVREALESIRSWGFVDSYRQHHADEGLFSWWDYRMLGFPKNRGLRIDHIFVTRSLAERCRDASIDREERKGKQPSDHAPVIASFDVE